MSSCLFILDESLEPLISKNVKSVRNLTGILEFFKLNYKENGPPVFTVLEWHYVFIKRDSLWFMTAIHETDDRITNLMALTFYLDQLYLLLKTYFNRSSLDRNIVLDNVLLIIELIDESMDFGIVQLTDPSIIKDYIRVKVNSPITHLTSDDDSDTEEKHKGLSTYIPGKTDIVKLWKGQPAVTANEGKSNEQDNYDDDDDENFINSYIAKTTIMPVSWRTKGIYYAKNEFFLDVIEKVQYLMDFSTGRIRKNLIHGEIKCKCYLSGMPTLKVALNKLIKNDEQFISNSKFHQCVSINSLKREINNEEEENTYHGKEIEFIPPDGEFVLCKYELKRHVRDVPVIKLSNIEIKPKLKKYKIQIHVTIETHFKKQNSTSVLTIKIPLRMVFSQYKIDLTKQPRFKSDFGEVLFNISDDFLIWEVGSMKGGNGESKNNMVAEFFIFNQEEYDRLQEEMKTSMNPPPLREGPKLEEIYEQTHDNRDEHDKNGISQQLLTMKFEVPYSTCSGLKVEYLKIEENQVNYQSFPWVRYKTINDDEYAYLI
ncbi:hypothetical protein Kpol_1056p13 [Vanderwaltozyma polyspora DSM 70294]|uniref:MHD domain-containing protein n=1 Tax=Vanderwaltozyma polyspora (strain ATCC 22028 / DSM 70294 / BCRC 21397 / CBS 2163 / NBRC 10782 / NRRL Y-8283 / UCD 57-17) TaxID=436907 RepID=A7TLM0_VANPO|nr:uncharacterized protein Kpol_1056p13 [Vanderwaltozyma polyspora DSM 70294]EDO16812.1 hypothetical protein Kpol_1056p13 [Vanderwaltozyma polyspora DSM 70294]